MAEIKITQSDAINESLENLRLAEASIDPGLKSAYAAISLSYTALIPYLPGWIPTPGHDF